MIDFKNNIKNNNILNVKKITISSLFLSLMIILSFTSNLAKVAIFPGAAFLHLEWADFMIFIIYHVVGFLFGLIIITLNISIRFIYDSADAIGVFALFLLYIFLFLSYIGSYKFFTYIFKKFKNEKKDKKIIRFNQSHKLGSLKIDQSNTSKKQLFLLSLISAIVAILITTFLISLCNYLFIFRLYLLYLGLSVNSIKNYNSTIIPFIVPFNLIKLSINTCIFLSIQPTLHILIDKYGL